jgi:2',3'-cyclic-nucleotide 2'-phosphodiesterase (5'-nucleotidase family)
LLLNVSYVSYKMPESDYLQLQKKIKKVQNILLGIEKEKGTSNKLYRAYTRKLVDYNNRIKETDQFKQLLDVEDDNSSARTGDLSFDDADDLVSRGDMSLDSIDDPSGDDFILDDIGEIEIDTSGMEDPSEVIHEGDDQDEAKVDNGKKDEKAEEKDEEDKGKDGEKEEKKSKKEKKLGYKALQKKIKKLKKSLKELEEEHGKAKATKRKEYSKYLKQKKNCQKQLEATPEYKKKNGIKDLKEEEEFPADGVWIRIIQINDVYELDNFPHFKTLVDQKKKCDASKTLVILSGDFVAPSLLSGLDKGRGMIDTMNKCDITHVCFGNHECDISMADLANRIKESKFKWVNTNMREIDQILDVKTDPHDVVEAKSKNKKRKKKIGLLGLLTEDPSIYRPGAFGGATIEPVLKCTQKYMKEVMDPLKLDLVVPLTHQRMEPDREFSKEFKGDIFPIVVGAHDHEPYDETWEGSRIIKTGMDGDRTAIIDIKWKSPKDKKPEVTVDMVTTQSYPPDRNILKVVQGHKRVLNELEAAKIFKLSNWLKGDDKVFSTKNNRLGPSTGSMALCSMFRMGMRVECCVCNSGAIRAGKVYPEEHEWFTWSDLKAEVPFSTELTAVRLPGRVIEETIRYSRRLAVQDPPQSSGGYLQHCDNIEMDEITCEIKKMDGKPFDPDRKYLLALPIDALKGIDDQVPLLEWAASDGAEGCCSSNDEGRPAKIVMVEMFSAMMWLDMGSFYEIDENNDGVLTREEVRERAVKVFGVAVADLVVDNIFAVADINKKGHITPVDMMVIEYAAHDMIDHIGTTEEMGAMQEIAADCLGLRASSAAVKELIEEMRDVLDADDSGHIDRVEAMKAAGEVHRQSLLS